jgi:myo-inositol-1(or 4)-monophosphatase
VLATGIPFRGHGQHDRFLTELARLMPQVAGVRRFGSAALDLAFVAAGRYEGFWERSLKPWDMAAGVLIVKEAGGTVTDPSGGEKYLESGDVVASNGALHRSLLPELK